MNLQWQRSTSTRAQRISLSFLLAALSSAGYGNEQTATPPQHWFISGQQPGQSQMEYGGALDRTIAYEGSGSGLLKSTVDTAHNGTLMQVSFAGAFRGKSIKLTAFLRSHDVARRAGLWIRADDANGTTVAFRNCLDARAPGSFVKDNTDWKEVEISIDIPDTAVALSYGVQMLGTGAVWIDNVSFEVVGAFDSAHTERVFLALHPPLDPQKLSQTPQNLDFEQ
jgi:hypothetical protein